MAWWTLIRGDGPVVAAAIHGGHEVRPELQRILALSDQERRYEEDPFTDRWTAIAQNRLVAHRSRFEVDLNRPRLGCVYFEPSNAWGLRIWKAPPAPAAIEQSLTMYDSFYSAAGLLLTELEQRFGAFVVLDLHSYNHRRGGPGAAADREDHPDVNIGTGTMARRDHWASVIDSFMVALRDRRVEGRSLEIGENIRFRGGYFPRWVHETFPESGCALAVEVKKFFMDEWTGEPYETALNGVQQALSSTIPVLEEALRAR